jgi:hypothetical protein
VLVAVAIFWLDDADLDARFGHAKDLITILVGVLGTVLGFYFGSASTGNVASPLAVSTVAVAPNPATAGDKVTVTAKISGGIPPYQYDITFTSSDVGVDASKMDIKGKSSATGDISEQVSTPTEVAKQVDVAVTIVIRDTKAAPTQSTPATLSLRPKSSTTPPAPSPETK